MRVVRSSLNFEREPLASAFGFKGSYLSELWQTVVLLESDRGCRGLGLGTQSTLWSDAKVFAAHSESAGNSLMYCVTAHVLKQIRGLDFEDPLALLEETRPLAAAYGQKITGNEALRLTFVLNALVPVDNAAWQLHAAEQGIAFFDEMIPADFREALSHRHRDLACVPLISYAVTTEEIARILGQGYFFLKIKIGCDPDGDGDPEKMLAWDKERLTSIHALAKRCETSHSESGNVVYYLDANGRYDSRDRLFSLLDHAKRIGALDRILLLEEPFPEESEIDVSDLPVRMAADESIHSELDVRKRVEMGYRAVALKPIAKTLSGSLKIAREAYHLGIPCFCADLTVNPILVDWNKNFAARVASLPGIKIGVLETNGRQNYRDWEEMKSYHPYLGAPWTEEVDGLFRLTDDFYARSGGVFESSHHYLDLVAC